MKPEDNHELMTPSDSEKYRPDKNYLLAEFTALRDEMQNRSIAQRQLISLAFIISGTLLTFGITHNKLDLFFLIPMFIFFLASGWGNHDTAIKAIGSYIRDAIEPYAQGIEWESSVQRTEAEKQNVVGVLWATIHFRGTFLLLQLIPIVVGLSSEHFKWETRSIILIGFDVLAIIGTWIALKHRPRKTT